MTQYIGVDNFPETILLPDDASPPTAAAVNPAFEGLGDRTTYLKQRVLEISQIPALSFISDVTASLAKIVKFNKDTREWLACDPSANDKFVSTKDPYTWPSSTEVTTARTLLIYDFDCNAAGNILCTSTANDGVWKRISGVWGVIGTVFGATATRAAVVWDPTAARWICASQVSGPAISVVNSPDAAFAWTSHTPPASPMPTSGSDLYLSTDGLGNVLMYSVSGTNFYTSKSTDGGVTWSATSTTALGFTASLSGNRAQKPVWCGDRWIVTVENTGTPRTKVFTSTDGLTWTSIADLTSFALIGFAAVGETLCGYLNTGLQDVVFSPDKGVTWYWAGRKLPQFPSSVTASPCQFLIAGGGYVFPSVAQGLGVAVAT